MHRLLVALLLFSSSFLVNAFELDYAYGLRKYNFKASEGEFRLKSPRMHLSIKRAKCNEHNLKRYQKKLVHIMGKFTHQELKAELTPEESLSKIVYQIDGGNKYVTGTKTEVGQTLLKIPNDFVVLKKQSCFP